MRRPHVFPRLRSMVFCIGVVAVFVAAPALSPGDEPKSDEPKKLAPDKVRLAKVDRAEFDKVVARHKGKVVLVDFWATWCAPCVKQFPHTVELARKYADKGLVVISVSFDDADGEAQVREFLAERGATFENLLSKVDAQQAIDDFKIDNGAIPNYWLYDRSGKIAKRFSPSDPTVKFKSEDIDAAVEELLGQRPK